MEDIVNLIATDAAASEISNSIKNALMSKASEKIENIKPYVSASMFGDESSEEESEEE